MGQITRSTTSFVSGRVFKLIDPGLDLIRAPANRSVRQLYLLRKFTELNFAVNRAFGQPDHLLEFLNTKELFADHRYHLQDRFRLNFPCDISLALSPDSGTVIRRCP